MKKMDDNALLKKYGIPLPAAKEVKTKQEAVDAAKQLGYPVVLKIKSSTILHKTDAGGVKLGIQNEFQLREAIEEMQKKIPSKDIQGFLVQKFYDGHYVLIGMKRDAQFGPVIAFGLGGIFVEIMKDVSFRVAPITEKDAGEMMKEVKAYSILEGARGGIKADKKLLVEILLAVSKMAMENTELKEIDLNPVVVNEKQAVAVDVRLIK
ncbi:MAG: acetate--CoA ligase family protein [Candidatus Nanoarchaeia archaeon]|nr:acetate--CoA ligase family protein [Candidatus Nanoarchaeia archaeon]